MSLPKTVMAVAALFVGVNCRYVYRDEYFQPRYVLDEANIAKNDYEDAMSEQNFESVQPIYLRSARSTEEINLPAYHVNLKDIQAEPPLHEFQETHKRLARQAQGQVDIHVPDRSVDISGAVPLTSNDKNILSAVGSVQGIKPGSFGSAGAGLSLNNANGHSLTAMGTHIPDLGNQLSAAGKLNLVHTKDHNLDANAFASRTFTSNSNPQLPNFNNYGGSLDYMYKGKVGATVGATHFPSFGRTDYSAMGKLNILKTPSSSVDFSSGVSRINTPFFSRTEPRFDFIFSKSF